MKGYFNVIQVKNGQGRRGLRSRLVGAVSHHSLDGLNTGNYLRKRRKLKNGADSIDMMPAL